MFRASSFHFAKFQRFQFWGSNPNKKIDFGEIPRVWTIFMVESHKLSMVSTSSPASLKKPKSMSISQAFAPPGNSAMVDFSNLIMIPWLIHIYIILVCIYIIIYIYNINIILLLLYYYYIYNGVYIKIIIFGTVIPPSWGSTRNEYVFIDPYFSGGVMISIWIHLVESLPPSISPKGSPQMNKSDTEQMGW